MLKRIAVFAIIALAVLAASVAYAQRQGGAGQDQPRNGRIVKGTIESISGGKVTVAVESIFIPREGEMKDAPKKLTIAINGNTRFVTKEGGRDAKRSDFKKGDDVVLMTAYEKDEYTLRAMMTPDVAAAMRKQLGEKMRQRGNTGQGGQGQRGMGRNGQDGQGQRGMGGNGQNGQRGMGGNGQNGQGGMRNRQLPALLSATIESVKGDTVKLTLTGVYKPSQGKELTIEPMQEKKTVEVAINDRTRFFVDGKKAQLSDFKRGEVVAVLIPRRGAKDGQAVLALMADKDSAGKLRDMLREKMQERRNNRRQQQ
jgi:hypothetical protein